MRRSMARLEIIFRWNLVSLRTKAQSLENVSIFKVAIPIKSL